MWIFSEKDIMTTSCIVFILGVIFGLTQGAINGVAISLLVYILSVIIGLGVNAAVNYKKRYTVRDFLFPEYGTVVEDDDTSDKQYLLYWVPIVNTFTIVGYFLTALLLILLLSLTGIKHCLLKIVQISDIIKLLNNLLNIKVRK